ncbi:hypothetical protein CI109_101481 [Kwoniella shandongensis]|uniref:Uncharacterized protein n=1 Tax=Kwoniella shandongensis TaxID=1734106 RepID=A0A5M6C6R6_9TREE|nr:uncharacterized protein CI109_001927 [Kwoniella shandongensis]KAA5529502.1 hypothetical protein CI109_001927 [Kwoniella shandongensis]
MPPPPSTTTATTTTTTTATTQISSPSLSHFVIFNPTLRLPKSEVSKVGDGVERDRDEEDDLREAAQIVFYTSREAGGVSRDKMLRQVGLAKGLMGFADMLAKDDAKYWSIHAHKSRLLIYSPEPDFYIYINITLAHTGEKKDPVPSAQGLSDTMLVDALARGYEDFRLLHGTLSSHPPSLATSSLFDKYFTRFAFSFESTYLTSPPPLSTWIGGYPSSSSSSSSFSIANLVTPFREGVDDKNDIYIIGKDGPLFTPGSADQTLIRFLFNLVQASLPPLSLSTLDHGSVKSDPRQSLGFGLGGLGLGRGRRKDESRKTSWATLGGWVPDIRRSSTPAEQVRTPIEGETTGRDGKGKWGFGLGGLGDAVGSVGTVFGLGGSPGRARTSLDIKEGDVASSTAKVDNTSPPYPIASEPEEVSIHEVSPSPVSASTTRAGTETDSNAVSHADPHHVEQSAISLPELESAVEPAVDLEWDDRGVYLASEDGSFQKRRLCWILRDNIVVAILFCDDATPPYDLPPTSTTLELFSRLSTSIAPHSTISRPSTPDSSGVASNTWLSKLDDGVISKQGEFDNASEQTLSELRGTLQRAASISEVYAKTSGSQFVVAKQSEEKELYLLVGRKEASLTDAEQAVRSFARLHPEFGG